jgi:uncharacterized RDD family membrane protein YckC
MPFSSSDFVKKFSLQTPASLRVLRESYCVRFFGGWQAPISPCRLVSPNAELRMETIRLTDRVSDSAWVYAGFGSRVLAKLIDDALVAVPLWILHLVLRSPFLVERSEQIRASIEGIAFFVVFCLYSALMESSKWQATFGKRTVGIVVMDLDGSRPSFGSSLLRAVVQCVPVEYLLAAFSPRRQALHDLVAGTVVVPGTL